MRARIGAVLAGLLAAALLLELALWAVGRVQAPRTGQLPVPKDRHYVIWCVGDSFTYGEGTEKEQSYPAQLERLLNGPGQGRSYRVVNWGEQGANSTVVREALDRLLARDAPDLVILTAGMTNYANYYGLAEYLRGSSSVRTIIEDRFNRLRVVRFLLKARDQVRARVAERAPAPVAPQFGRPLHLKCPAFSEAMRFKSARDYARAAQWFDRALLQDPGDPDVLFQKGEMFKQWGDVAQATACFQRTLALFPTYAPALNALAWLAMGRQDVPAAADLFMRALERDPVSEYNFSGLLAAVRMSHDPTLRVRAIAFLSMLRSRPGVNVAVVGDMLILLQGEGRGEALIADWLMRDMHLIVDACRRRGVPLIMQEYPRWQGNALLRAVALRHAVPFVLHEDTFGRLGMLYGRDAFFSNDRSHCNARGYGVMAANVLQVLREQGICPDASGKERT